MSNWGNEEYIFIEIRLGKKNWSLVFAFKTNISMNSSLHYIAETNLRYESGDQVDSFDEKTKSKKSHACVPLRRQSIQTIWPNWKFSKSVNCFSCTYKQYYTFMVIKVTLHTFACNILHLKHNWITCRTRHFYVFEIMKPLAVTGDRLKQVI